MDDNKLHIIPKITSGETYDKAMGSLVLKQAETFFVTIAEYEKDEKEIKKLEEKKRAIREFAVKKMGTACKRRLGQKKARGEL
jgi:ribosome-binding factor A